MPNFASASIIEGEWIKNTKANSLHVLKKIKEKKGSLCLKTWGGKSNVWWCFSSYLGKKLEKVCYWSAIK